MSGRWIRVRPGPRETVGALVAATAVAAGVGTVVYYMARLMLCREPVGGETSGSSGASVPDEEEVE